MSRSALMFSALLLLSGSSMWGVVFRAAAQSPPAASITLSEDSTSSSQLAAIRSDLVSAITQGASPEETTTLVKQQRRIDGLLQGELDSIRAELAEIQRAEFDPATQPRRQELRRRQSLLWLSRVELAAMATELFAQGSPDSQAMARQAVHLIQEAIATFPSDGVVRDELVRLLYEAQLRGGEAETAIRTMHQAARSRVFSGAQLNEKADQQSPGDELSINTAEELAFVIRVDLAKHQWEAAKSKLDQFYGDTPDSSPRSTAMDLARLQYLIVQPQRDSTLTEIGHWLDRIEKRSGAIARRNAETMLSREREFRGADSSAIDPRVLRADARYYLRVGKTLPAALLFARAAVDDADENRSIDSAVRSAAILEGDSKRPAAAQLLRQTAVRHQSNSLAPMLMLQAATLLSSDEQSQARQSEPSASPEVAQENAHDVLLELLARWPASTAAAAARDALIATAGSRGQWTEAAEWATQLPAEHWNQTTATRCRTLWQRAIMPAGAKPACHWDDEACQRAEAESIAMRLERMRAAFAAVTSNALAAQTMYACTILLDDLAEAADPDRPLVLAENGIEDAFLQTLAQQRLGRSNQITALESDIGADENYHAVVVWRLGRDLANNPVLHRSSASLLLALTDNDETRDVSSRLQWLMWSGQVPRGLTELRASLSTAENPGDLLAAAASALADSTRSGDLMQASDLWKELALGIPTSHRSHHRAKVESILCQWRSGDQAGARSVAELMLLTNPPSEKSLRERLQKLSQ